MAEQGPHGATPGDARDDASTARAGEARAATPEPLGGAGPGERRTFLSELKRRRVPRAAVAYLVAASGILQGLNNISNAYDVPHGVVSAIRVLLIVGFPLSLVVSWFYDIAPLRPGEQRGEAHPHLGHGLLAPERRVVLRKPTWTVIGLMAVAVAGLTAWQVLRGGGDRDGAPKLQTILIADFENATSEGVFDGTLEPAFTLAMEGASFITSYSRPSAQKTAEQLKLAGIGLDFQRARLVASREGISVVTAGRIAKADGYQVEVRVVDGITGKEIVKASSSVRDKQAVLAAVTKVAARVREALGDATPEAVQLAAGETFSAASVEAAHAYSVGMNHQFGGRWDDAVKAYLDALKLDPGMGRAYAGLAVVESNRGHRSEAVRYFREAMARVERMTEREKYRSRGAYYLAIEHDPDRAIEALTPLVKQYPADNAGLANLGIAYQLKRDFPRALEEERKAIAIYPKNVPQRNNVGLFAMYLGDFDTALQEQQMAIELNPTFIAAYGGLALAQLAAGKRDAALQTWAKVQAMGDAGASAAAEGLADLALYEGRQSEARLLLEKGIDIDTASRDGDALARKLVALAAIRLAHGELAPALAAAERARRESDVEYLRFMVGWLLADAGQDAKALAIADELGARLAPEPRMYADLIRGAVDVHGKRFSAAVGHYQQAVQRVDAWVARYALGVAYVEAGAFVEAQEELERCQKRRGEATDVFLDVVPTYRMYAPVAYHMGRAYDGVKSASGADWYRAFLANARSDEDALVAEARRRLAGR